MHDLPEYDELDVLVDTDPIALLEIAWRLRERARIAEEAIDQDHHIINWQEDGWTISHAFSCRPNLDLCPFNDIAEGGLPSGSDWFHQWRYGRYRFDGPVDGFTVTRIDP